MSRMRRDAVVRVQDDYFKNWPSVAELDSIADTQALGPFDASAVEKSMKDPAIRQHLATLAHRLEKLPEFTHESLEATIRGLAEELDIKPGVLMSAAESFRGRGNCSWTILPRS